MVNCWSRAMMGAMAGLVAAALVTPASAQGTLAKVKAAGVLRIGIADNIPWSKLEPDGKLTGIAPLQVEAVAKRMGLKVEAIVATYGQLIPGLNAGRWDMIGASYTITPNGCDQMLYTDPFFRNTDTQYGSYLAGEIKTPLPKNFTEVAQTLTRVGITTGSAQLPFLQKAVADTGSKLEIVTFSEPPLLLDGLKAKRVQMIITDRKTMEAWKKSQGGFEAVSVDNGQPNRGSGGGFRKEDTDLRDAFVKEQRALKASGEVAKILAQFEFAYDEKAMNISGEEACKL